MKSFKFLVVYIHKSQDDLSNVTRRLDHANLHNEEVVLRSISVL